MKYKVGDKVKIKTWEEMEKEFGLSSNLIKMHKDIFFTQSMEKYLKEISIDRILTIKEIYNDNDIYMEEIGYVWKDCYIEGLVVEEIFEPIENRAEILDLRR